MNQKHSLVIIDTDYEYVRSIEADVIRKYADRVDVHIITEPDYITSYFNEPKKIDVLIIDRKDYGDFLKEHQIRQTFIMIPEIGIEEELPQNVSVMVKYLPVEDIFQAVGDVYARIDLESMGQRKGRDCPTRVIAVYSPIGGCGKSLISIGLSRKLAKLDQEVLLIGCDDVQSFAALYDVKDFADDHLAAELRDPGEDTYWTFLQNLEADEFTYLKPFRRVPHAVGVGRTQWRGFLNLMREKKDFDYIILDIGTRVDEAGRELMDKADAIILVTEPNLTATKKMQRIAGDADMLPAKKCFVISNQYHTDGLRFSEDAVFDRLAAYPGYPEALEDPVFYRLALRLLDTM